jgi:hypothetical protein
MRFLFAVHMSLWFRYTHLCSLTFLLRSHSTCYSRLYPAQSRDFLPFLSIFDDRDRFFHPVGSTKEHKHHLNTSDLPQHPEPATLQPALPLLRRNTVHKTDPLAMTDERSTRTLEITRLTVAPLVFCRAQFMRLLTRCRVRSKLGCNPWRKGFVAS